MNLFLFFLFFFLYSLVCFILYIPHINYITQYLSFSVLLISLSTRVPKPWVTDHTGPHSRRWEAGERVKLHAYLQGIPIASSHPLSVKILSSTKPVPGAEKVANCWLSILPSESTHIFASGKISFFLWLYTIPLYCISICVCVYLCMLGLPKWHSVKEYTYQRRRCRLHPLYPFICCWILKLLPYLGYCK